MAEGRHGGRSEAADAAAKIAGPKSTAASLERTTALLDAIGRHSTDAIYAKDPDGRFLYANAAVLAIIGQSADRVLGHTDAEFHSDPEQAAAVMANDRRIMRGGVAEVIEETWTTTNSGVRTYRSTKAPYYGDDGSLIGIVCISSDITDLKTAKADLRQANIDMAQSESQFRALANGIPQLCWMANADGWIFWYNDRWYDYTGTTPHQMEGWGWQSVQDPEALPAVMERWRASIATGQPFDMVFPLRGADGVFRPFLTRVRPVLDGDGNVSRWFGTNTDITEQRKAEEEIRAGRAKLEAALNSMADAVFISDTQGNFIHFNDAFATFHKFKSVAECAKTLAEYPHFLDVYLPDGRLASLDQWAVPRALRGETVVGAEYTLRRKDTGETWIGSYNFAPIRDREGRITGAVVTGRDITERRAAQARIASLNEQLIHVTRAHELGQISAGIAHELNQPLAAIVNYASIANRLIAKENAPSASKAQEAIGKAGEQAKRAAEIIRRMREFVERRQTHRAPQDVNDIVKDAVALALVGSKGDNIATILHLAPDLPAVEADRVQIEQVLVNLLRNAVQAMEASSKREVTISTHMNSGGLVEVSVADTGPGISRDIVDRLFQPFATTKADGMGVGLAISRSIIEAHGGQLGTIPNPDGGALFRFTLPATAAAPRIS